MKPSVKEKWIKALRSGKYKQGSAHLYDAATESYCCLGVLAEIEVGSVDAARRPTGEEFLAPQFLERFGLTEDEQRHLSKLNDGSPFAFNGPIEQHSFEEIANYIEKNL
ncbi:MAG TPA: hypothetical protein VLG09_03880 [Candidatus Saccharimonadales bacterium]|nr:hypothetical protein [Candidatus Saccharimonadales bacterium]